VFCDFDCDLSLYGCIFRLFQYEQNKSYCEDLTEGKFSFPLIHGINSDKGDNQILSILRQRTQDNDVKKYCVELLRKKGSFDYTKATLIELEKQ